MVSEREEDSFSLHSLVTCHELDFGEREGVAQVERAVHIRICHTAEEFGVFLPQFLNRDICFDGRTIRFPNVFLFPYLLVSLLDCYRRISFLCLKNPLVTFTNGIWNLFELF